MIRERLNHHTGIYRPTTSPSPTEYEDKQQSILLKDFVRMVAPAGFPSIHVETVARLFRAIAPYTTDRSLYSTQKVEGNQFIIRGGAFLDAIYGHDPYEKAPARILASRSDRQPYNSLPSNIRDRVSGYIPDLDVSAEFNSDTIIEDIQASIQKVIGVEPDTTIHTGGRTILNYNSATALPIKVVLDTNFGDPQGIVKRLRAKIFFEGDGINTPPYAVAFVEDIENREGPRYSKPDWGAVVQTRCHAFANIFMILNTANVCVNDFGATVEINDYLKNRISSYLCNPFLYIYHPRVPSHVYSTQIHTMASCVGRPIERIFNPINGAQQADNPDSNFVKLVKDANTADNDASYGMRKLNDREITIFRDRIIPFAQIDITYALIRNPFRFLRLLFAMKNLCATLPLGNLHGDEVLEKMRALLAERTGQPIDTLDKASEVYEQYVLAPGTNLPTGLEMLAEITENQDVLALFTPNSSQMTQK